MIKYHNIKNVHKVHIYFPLYLISITNTSIMKNRLNATDTLSIRFLPLLLSKYSLHFKYFSPS